MTTYSIFGAGAAGLYTAWRLANTTAAGDTIDFYDWGEYQFGDGTGTRSAAGRICSYHHLGDPDNPYIEVGGMRYIEWDGTPDGAGHRLVTTLIEAMGLTGESVPFKTTANPLFYLRARNFYSKDIDRNHPAPYNAAYGLQNSPPDQALSFVAAETIDPALKLDTRAKQCAFYREGRLPDTYTSHVFEPRQRLRDIGYWNLLSDTLTNEGYDYAEDGGGYDSNVINWNAADALIYNSEFAPGGSFKTLRTGYSTLFLRMFEQIQATCRKRGVRLVWHPGVRLHSITAPGGVVTFRTASRARPDFAGPAQTTDHAFLALPPQSLDLVADASRYAGVEGDVLNAGQVPLYREAAIKQPSYKIAMFFDREWWKDTRFPPELVGSDGSTDNVFGPTITDTPLRQIYYFGANGTGKGKPVYGLLASYDDERFVKFWAELELGPERDREIPRARDLQPLHGPRQAPAAMVAMLRSLLARVHNGPDADATTVPLPLETVFMDWGLNPFGAGYHAWAAHYDICDVMQRVRKPSLLTDGPNASIYIVGSAYSNDQAWVEGAFCTAESVLNDFFGLKPLIDTSVYPLICGCD